MKTNRVKVEGFDGEPNINKINVSGILGKMSYDPTDLIGVAIKAGNNQVFKAGEGEMFDVDREEGPNLEKLKDLQENVQQRQKFDAETDVTDSFWQDVQIYLSEPQTDPIRDIEPIEAPGKYDNSYAAISNLVFYLDVSQTGDGSGDDAQNGDGNGDDKGGDNGDGQEDDGDDGDDEDDGDEDDDDGDDEDDGDEDDDGDDEDDGDGPGDGDDGPDNGGPDGNDTIQGLGGDDRIFGNADRGQVSIAASGPPAITVGDNLFGNAGADTFVYQAGDGVDLIWDFKAGAGDHIVFEGLDSDQVETEPFDLDDGYLRDGLFIDADGDGTHDDGAIVFKDPARIDSSFFAEHVTFSDNITPPPPTPGGMTGTVGPDTFASPGAQADSYAGLGGADKIFGNEGEDHLDGGAGNDEVQSTRGASTLIGGTGDDLIEASGADDHVWGGASAGGDGDTPAEGGPDGDGPDKDGPGGDTPDEGDTGDGSGLAATVTDSWEGGYIADFTVRVGYKGFSAFQAEIDPGTTGEVVSGWSSDLGAPLAFARDGAHGVFDNLEGWQRPLGPDDTFTLSVEVAGGTPDDDTLDLSPVTNRASVDEAEEKVNFVPFGNGQYLLTGTVTNTGEEAITDWELALDFDAPFNVETVWGGTVTKESQVHVEAASWNGAIAPGDSADFGLVGTAELETEFTGATFV